jgi:uncharacterized protein YdeI (YjbR/CyaY-like superfamily)
MEPGEWMAFQDTNNWSEWLSVHHRDSTGIWLRIKRKHSDLIAMDLDEAVTTALCFGWIDSQLRPLDKQSYLLHFTPRRPSSVWSLRNRKKAETLMREGQMQEAGLKVIQSAKASGAWDQAYSAGAPIENPEDLANNFIEHPEAGSIFGSWSNSDRTQVVYWLNQAKKPETRQARILRLIQLLEDGLSLKELK